MNSNTPPKGGFNFAPASTVISLPIAGRGISDMERFMRMVAPVSAETWFTIHHKYLPPGATKAVMPGSAHKTIATAMNDATYWANKRASCVYISQPAYKTIGKGEQKGLYPPAFRDYTNIAVCKNLYIDCDVKEDGYHSVDEMKSAVMGFLKWANIPLPNVVVGSGNGGWHIYWCMDTTFELKEFKRLAGRLISAATEYGLLFDRECTTDATRLLRVVGTWNFKYATPEGVTPVVDAKPVTLVHCDDGKFINLNQMTKALERWPIAVVTQGVSPPIRGAVDAHGLPLDENADLTGGMKKEYTPANIDEVAQHCAFIKNTLEQGGANLVGDPQWHNVIALACHTDNPFETARRLCEKSPHYTLEGNEQKLATAQQARLNRQTIGPPKCAHIAIEREECKTCPHLQLGTSPLSVGYKSNSPGNPPSMLPTTASLGRKNYAAMRAALILNPSTAQAAAIASDRTIRKIYNNAVAGGLVWAKSPYDTAKLFQNNLATPLIFYQGKFYEWDGRCWPELEDAALRARIYAFLDRCHNKAGNKISPMTRGDDGVNEILAALRGVAHQESMLSIPAWLDEANRPEAGKVIVCDNGLFDLSTGILLPHTPMFFTHNALDFAYDPNAPQPTLWLNFLDQVLPNDQEAIDTLQEEFGYYLTPDTSQQKIFMLIGKPRSGKGTIARILDALLGRFNCVAATLTGIGKTFGRAPLIGKSVAIIADARLSGRADPSEIIEYLLSISGEDKQTVQRKNISDWDGKLNVRFVILSNELFRLADASKALVSRLIIILFKQSFYGREDPNLYNKLLSELPGILNWAIEGWVRLNARGHFVQPQSSLESLGIIENLASPVGAFIKEKCDVGPAFSVSKDDLFNAWIGWCVGQRIERSGTKIGFGRDLHAALPEVVSIQPRNAQGGRVETHQGIGLKTNTASATAINPRGNLRVVPPAALTPPNPGAAPPLNSAAATAGGNKP